MLRGAAALAVVFYHTDYVFNGGVHTEFQAVNVFFVISGFIMTYITREESREFFTQRLIRIVPPYWLCTLLPVMVMWLRGSMQSWSGATPETIVESLLFIPFRDSLGGFSPVLPVGWTLNFEMLFYLLFAGALVISQRWAPLIVCTALFAIQNLYRLGCTAPICEFYAYNSTWFLVVGILSFYIWTSLKGLAEKYPHFTAVAAVASVAAFILYQAHPPLAEAIGKRLGFKLTYLMPGLLVMTGLLLHSAHFRCNWKIPLMIGAASYAIYLTHVVVMEFGRVFRNKTVGDGIDFLDPSKNVMAMVAVIAVCGVIGALFHYGVEVPILRHLRRRFLKRSALSTAAPPASAGAGATSQA